ncbi:hypothetical protein [Aquincola sp. J276]|uniref:hypothetical protein n=1 Tax=Aquincola sp. J276 TaxID=2898432 RepID=UPI0021512472|nr:hypothetical protein [Aquincola sp. J276]MCR5868494.1 hypothetical protein [Aquincola sp. J276]
MQLEPKHPPRRTRYKLCAYSAEIHRLNAEGYTCDEIRDALAAVGLVVSRSTVQREAARGRQRPVATSPASSAVAMTTAGVVAPPAVMTTSSGQEPVPSLATSRAVPPADDPRTAKQVAEDFMKDQITNPLLRTERKP